MKLVLLDVDGTLIDSARIILDSQIACCDAFGLPHPGEEAGLGVIGLSLPLALASLTGRDDLAAAMAARYSAIFQDMRQNPAYEEALYPGVAETIAHLAGRGDILLGLATGKSRRGADRLLARENWGAHFTVVRTADDGPSKPHPEMILSACAQTGIAPVDTVMVGDSVFDMQMAKSAGARALGVAYGFQPADKLREAGAEHILERFCDLPAHL